MGQTVLVEVAILTGVEDPLNVYAEFACMSRTGAIDVTAEAIDLRGKRGRLGGLWSKGRGERRTEDGGAGRSGKSAHLHPLEVGSLLEVVRYLLVEIVSTWEGKIRKWNARRSFSSPRAS
jgi:hypothetical protein